MENIELIPSYYIYSDLRSAQNYNILRFDQLEDAITAFNRMPKDWTTAIGIRLAPNSELDLVQRREGEPVLLGDYQRIPRYFYHPAVQQIVQTLVSQMNIQWQSDYRIFGTAPVLIPPILNQSFVRDRFFNDKHLCPDEPKYMFSSIQELYIPEQGWQPPNAVYEMARKFGYNNPHQPKITTLHVKYTDEKNQVRAGDINPYNYILLQERSMIRAHDKIAITALAKEIEEYISNSAPDYYTELFGSADRNQLIYPNSFVTFRDVNVERLTDQIKKQDLNFLAEAILSSLEKDHSSRSKHAEGMELLGRIMNIQEPKKLSIDLRMRASTVFGSYLHGGSQAEHTPSQNGRQ